MRSVAQFLVGRGRVDTKCFVEKPVELPNRPGDTEPFGAIRIGAKMVAARSQHQLRATLGADMQKR